MKIDLHVHSKEGSDGNMSVSGIFAEAEKRGIGLISITDHDSVDVQEAAQKLAQKHHINYLCGVELNVTFSHPGYSKGKQVSLDFLGYSFDIHNQALRDKLAELKRYREIRAKKILDNINEEFKKQGLPLLTQKDLLAIQATVDGIFARPHIANYMIEKGIVADKQEAFDKYLVKCDVPKMPLLLAEASAIIHDAGGKLILAHPNDPNGTSLVALTKDIREQQKIILECMILFIDGIECWHSRHDEKTIDSYVGFARENNLLATGGSDCHQQPVIMGTVDVPDYVAYQFGF
jgi:predicted metal-dependent phosphoesterase TrpH